MRHYYCCEYTGLFHIGQEIIQNGIWDCAMAKLTGEESKMVAQSMIKLQFQKKNSSKMSTIQFCICSTEEP